MKSSGLALVLAPVGVVVALVAAVVLLLVGLPLPLALVVGIVAGALGALLLVARSEAMVAGGLPMHEATPAAQPRLHNMVDGLIDSHGFRRPRLMVIDDPARNALVYGRNPARATLAVTAGLLDALDRMELEGLLARELALAGNPRLPAATVLVPVAGMLPGGLRGRVVARFLGPHRAVLDDFGAVRLTRYPPGLAAALDKLGQGSTVVAGAGRTSSYLWVAAPTAAGPLSPGTPDIDERAAALREL